MSEGLESDGAEANASAPREASFGFVLAFALVLALVLVVRTLGFEQVFQGGAVVFPPDDPQYHLRRAYYSFVNFPSVLLFDVYINHPGGSAISWPPGYDFALGGLARLFARDVHGFEVVAAWVPPVLAALTVIPLAFAGAALGSRWIGLAAGCVFAFVPVSFHYSALGNTDHHAAVSAIGAWLLCLCMKLVGPALSLRRLAWLAGGLFVAQVAMLLTWHGSLLYLGPLSGILLVAASWRGASRLALAHALAAAATATALVPILTASPEPLGGRFSSIALSWLDVLALLGVAAVAVSVALAPRRLGAHGPAARIGWLACGVGLFALGAILVPGVRAGLAPALGFVAMTDGAGPATNEQRALFAFFGRAAEADPALAWGFFAYLLPLAPVAALLRARAAPRGSSERAAAAVLTVWSGLFAVLAISQMRYGNDFAPAASLCFALALATVARSALARAGWVASSRALAPALGAMLFGVLVAPAVVGVFLPRAASSLATLRGEAWPLARAATSVEATAARFFVEVSQVTPETSSYLSDWRGAARPEYGVIAHPNLGHAIQYLARRPTGTDPFWAYIGARNWAFTRAFLGARSERQALSAAAALAGRYLVTMPVRESETVSWQLHFFDGAATGRQPRLERFRLITESAEPGQSLLARRQPDPPDATPYKLFEIVAGALLEVDAQPATEVVATLSLSTPAGRTFEHVAGARAGGDAKARLRLPYATDGATPVRARGAWRVRVGDEVHVVRVSEQSVVKGEVVRLEPGAPRG